MRRLMVYVLGVLLLVSACASSDGGDAGQDERGGGEKGSYESVKTSVDDLTAKLLPALASGLSGQFPLVRGQFTECGVGPNNQKYSVRGELHSQVADDAEAAESIRAVLTDAGLDRRHGGHRRVEHRTAGGRGRDPFVLDQLGVPLVLRGRCGDAAGDRSQRVRKSRHRRILNPRPPTRQTTACSAERGGAGSSADSHDGQQR
jgi:hypothetical protein